jgi:hypothetical protein
MARIPVTRWRRALIDDEDLPRCAPLRWYTNTDKKTRKGRTVSHTFVYAIVLVNGKKTVLRLARYIANCPPGKRVWHINGNALDCRKSNLRISGERLVPADEAFAEKHDLPDIFTLLEDSENGA